MAMSAGAGIGRDAAGLAAASDAVEAATGPGPVRDRAGTGPTNRTELLLRSDTTGCAAGCGGPVPVIARVMAKAAEPAVLLSVPLQVDAHAASNWDEAH